MITVQDIYSMDTIIWNLWANIVSLKKYLCVFFIFSGVLITRIDTNIIILTVYSISHPHIFATILMISTKT